MQVADQGGLTVKAKKISMVISIFLFILGLVSSAFLAFTNTLDANWNQLLQNLSLGISTGGLVAVLIEIPLSFSNINAHKQLLLVNSLYAYIPCIQLIDLIDKAYQDENTPMYENFCSNLIQQITQFVTPLLNLDPHMYFCSCRRNQIDHFKSGINNFLMQRDIIDSCLRMKLINLKIEGLAASVQSGQSGFCTDLGNVLTSKNVRDELQEIKSNILPLLDAMDDTMRLVLSEKELKTWQNQTQFMNATIKQWQKGIANA